jgi:hypothetical protein
MVNMTLEEFSIGLEFYMSGKQWRCTDLGTRTVIAIRIDETTVTSFNTETGISRTKIDKEDKSLYLGPPYAVAEQVLDENDIDSCSLVE